MCATLSSNYEVVLSDNEPMYSKILVFYSGLIVTTKITVLRKLSGNI